MRMIENENKFKDTATINIEEKNLELKEKENFDLFIVLM